MSDTKFEAADRPVMLEIRNLVTSFGPPERTLVAVDRLSLKLRQAAILGLVGESG